MRAVQLAEAAAQLAQGAAVWASADVLTPSAWARREFERAAEREPAQWPRILRSSEEWLLWREAVEEVARELPLLDTDLLAEGLRRASERAAAFGLRPDPGAAGGEAGILRRAEQIFATRCREMNAATVSTLLPRLRALRADTSTPAPMLRGFDAIPGAFAPLTGPERAPRASSATAPYGVRPADARAQIEAIAAWCCERLRADPAARLLVILPGSAGERDRAAALIRGALDPATALAAGQVPRPLIGIEGGEVFGSLPLAEHAILSLSLLSSAELETDAIGSWLTGPYWVSPGCAPRAALALSLGERLAPGVRLRELLGALQLVPRHLLVAARELDTRLRRAAAALGEGCATARRWAERIEASLAALGWPGAVPPDSELQQMRLRWRELLEEFGALAATLGEVRLGRALEVLRALALRTPWWAPEEDVPVLISPVLADPVVIYDGIWVGSLTAETLPQPVMPDPFLPVGAQIEAGCAEASVAGRRAQAHSLLAAWRAATGELVLSSPRREGDLDLVPSPLLEGIAWQEWHEEDTATVWLPRRLHREECSEAIYDDRGPGFNPRTPLPSGVRSLTLQSACPFRAYAELRLGAREPDRTEPGIPMDQRGRLLHVALQLLWQRLRDSQTLAALDRAALHSLIEACVRQAAAMLPAQLHGRRARARAAIAGQIELFPLHSPALERECRRAAGLIARLCELERTRAPFTVDAVEREIELSLGGGRVCMRIDRIDSFAGGRAVLDYKSGRPSRPDWLAERPAHPQLLAYLAALGREVVALAMVNLTAREVSFNGVASIAGLLPRVRPLPAPLPANAAADWSSRQRRWEELIGRLIRAFIEGDARVDPVPGACDHCHLPGLCRIVQRPHQAARRGKEDAGEFSAEAHVSEADE